MQRSRKWLRWTWAEVMEALAERQIQAVVVTRLLQSHSQDCDCSVNGVWSFKHDILAMLPLSSAFVNDSREQTKAWLLICNWSEISEHRLRCCCWEEMIALQMFLSLLPSFSFVSHTDRQLREQIRSETVDQVSIGQSPTTLYHLTPAPTTHLTTSKQKSMGCSWCLRCASDKWTLGCSDTRWETGKGWENGVGGDTDEAETDWLHTFDLVPCLPIFA